MFELADIEPSDPTVIPAYTRLSALLLIYSAFEAYLNHLGSIIAPETWKEERTFFTRTPHRGTLGKYIYLTKRIGIDIDKGALPHQDLEALDSWRHFVVHGRDESLEIRVKRGPAGIETEDNMRLFNLDNNAERIRDSIETACDALNSAALEIAPDSDLSALGAFEGSLGNGSFWPPKENERDNQQG